ncbi:TPA: TrkH family potassium uptake protein, partial [Candidatus Bathyarchaeota archaeon]|nr:TrkH family potassium uptake protein [Candidatus Bathyarchaeota archaeon]
FWNSLRYGIFHATSILTTTGYTLTNIAEFPSLTTWILTILMFIGGGLGSTGGAIKIIRIVILIKAVHYMVSKAALPERAIKPFKIGDHVVGGDETFRVMSFVSAYFLLIIIEGILISFLGGFDPLTAISGALSAQGNVGPCLLPVSKTLSDPVKAVLIFGMWAGRLEIFPVLAILSPYTWKELSRLKALRKMR